MRDGCRPPPFFTAASLRPLFKMFRCFKDFAAMPPLPLMMLLPVACCSA